MTRTRPAIAAVLSANDVFKLRYPRYLKGAILAALAMTALFTWLWPGYQAQPYQARREETIIIEIETEAPVIAPPRPIEAPRLPPVVEPARADDPDAEDTIPELFPFDYPFTEPAPGGMGEEGFVASSALPELVAFAKADYPELARRARIEGTVVIEVLVTAGGGVGHASILQSVHPLLDKAAMAAALRCRFTPARQRELAVPVRVAIPYRFRMN